MSFSENLNRDDVVSSAVQFLAIHKQFQNTKVLGSGTFGDVRLMYDPRRKSDITVKIVRSEFRSESESTLWPRLRHPNVVHLLEYFIPRTPSVEIYVMPAQRSTLWDILVKEQLYNDGSATDQLAEWMQQVLCGLEYLHSKEMCHLDIQADNVLVSHGSVAMLCDFTFLNETTKPLGRRHLGLPYIFRPPQVCPTMGPDITVDGKSFDLWSYGVMVLEIFTKFPISIHLKQTNCWLRDHYPLMFEIMQADNFFILMRKAFSGVQIKKFLATQALRFIHGFLMLDCNKRTSAATRHHFLKKGIGMGPPPDAIWIRKVSSDDVTLAAFKEKCLSNCNVKDKTSKEGDRRYSEVEDYSDRCSNQNANDDPPTSPNEDSSIQKRDFIYENSRMRPYIEGEPNRMDLMGDMETDRITIDVNSEGDGGDSESNKILNYEMEFEERNLRNFKKWEESETTLESVAEKVTFDLPSVTGTNISDECRLEINIENVTRYMNERIRMEHPPFQDIVFDAVEEDEDKRIGRSSRKVGRGRKVVQWLSKKCLQLEKVVKRRPYKLMKE